MTGRLLLTIALALSILGVSGLLQLESGKMEDFHVGVPVSNPDVPNAIPNKYNVVYNKTFTDDDIEGYETDVIKTIAKRNLGKRSFLTWKLLSTTVKSFRLVRGAPCGSRPTTS